MASRRQRFRPKGSFSCRLGCTIGLSGPCKAHSLVEASSAGALLRPLRPQGWLATHCEPITYAQSSAQKAQRIVRNALIISEIPATLGTSSKPSLAGKPPSTTNTRHKMQPRASSAGALLRPSHPPGWLATHCEPITYAQSSALFAQRITRNTLSISEIPATLGASSKPPSASSPHNHAPPPYQQQASISQ